MRQRSARDPAAPYSRARPATKIAGANAEAEAESDAPGWWEREKMSENVPPPGRPGREAEVLQALREASRDNPRLVELPPEEVTRQLVLEGRVEGEPSPEIVAEMMLELEVEEQEFDPDVQPGEV